MLLYGNNLDPSYFIAVILAALVAMTVHEFAHNYVGYLMGDPYPARAGKLTLDPTAHIYWPGFIMFVLVGFGILGTAPIAAHRMRNPRWGYMAAVAAGPLSNLLLAIIFAIVMRILGIDVFDIFGNRDPIAILLYVMVSFNVLLFIFNCLPFFPIDGWHVVLALLPPDLADWWQRNAMNSQYVLLGLIIWSFVAPPGANFLSLLIAEPHFQITAWLLNFPI